MFQESRNHGPAEFVTLDEVRLTFDAFFDQVDRLAGWLQKTANIIPGQSVAICMKNCPEWMTAFVAITNIGAVPISVNSRGEGAVMLHAIQDSDSVFVIADVKRLDAYQRPITRLSLVIPMILPRCFLRPEPQAGLKPPL